jgi:FHA domain
MPVTCPNGHRSAAGDYCDECGARLAGDPSPGAAGSPPAPPSTADPDPPAPAATTGDPAVEVATVTITAAPSCPLCGEPRIGAERFCENDAYDFLTGLPPAADPAGADPTGPAAAAPAWALTVSADRAWWEKMATELPFPDRCPMRTFPLAGPQVLLGRPRPSRGIAPQVDLTGPPLDEGISHAHALLTRVDTGWQLSDAGSTNGTWLPGADAPLAPGQHVLLADGDTFLIGAWTALTVHAR